MENEDRKVRVRVRVRLGLSGGPKVLIILLVQKIDKVMFDAMQMPTFAPSYRNYPKQTKYVLRLPSANGSPPEKAFCVSCNAIGFPTSFTCRRHAHLDLVGGLP